MNRKLALMVTCLVASVSPAVAQSETATERELRELRQQFQEMQRRMNALERRVEREHQAAARPAPAPSEPTRPLPPQAQPSPSVAQGGGQPAQGQPQAPGQIPVPVPPQGAQQPPAQALTMAPPGRAFNPGEFPVTVPPQGAQQPPGEAASLGTTLGFVPIPGTGAAARLYGFAVGVLSHDFSANNPSDAVTAQSIPLSPSAASRLGGGTLFSARRSRVGLETYSSTELGPFRTIIELDFAGSQSTASLQSQATSNGYIPRLRQAYGELGPFLAGQTWSLFFDEFLPQRLDYGTPLSTSDVRQAQFRYTHSFGHGLSLAGSIEQPYTDFTSTNGVRFADEDTGTAPPLTINQVPDFLTRLHWQDRPNGNSIALTGLLRPEMQVTNEGAFNPAARYQQSTVGWGVQLSAAALTFGSDHVFLRFVYGQGVGRYLPSTANGQGGVTNAGLPGVSSTQVRIDAVPVVAGLLGYTHRWTEALRTNVAMGWAALSYPGYADEFAPVGATALNQHIGQGWINLIWSPIPRVDVGIEYLGTTRQLLRALPPGEGTEGAKGGVSHRLVVSVTSRF